MFKTITLFIFCSTNYADNKIDTCDECYGNGSQTCEVCDRGGVVECSECKGIGSVTDDEGDTEDCYDCNGNGNNPCYNCDGEGDVFCDNCGGDGEVKGDEFFDYSLYLTAGLMDKSDYNILRKYEAYNDSEIIDTINDLKYTVDLYEYSGTLEEGDSLFNSNDVMSSSNYFFGLLDDYKKNDKYSNFRIGTIEEYI
jgi:RecJ-like exonuclease